MRSLKSWTLVNAESLHPGLALWRPEWCLSYRAFPDGEKHRGTNDQIARFVSAFPKYLTVEEIILQGSCYQTVAYNSFHFSVSETIMNFYAIQNIPSCIYPVKLRLKHILTQIMKR